MTSECKNICPFCTYQFTTQRRLESHLRRKNPCTNRPAEIQLEPDVFVCQYCEKKLSRKDSLNRHLRVCKLKISLDNNISEKVVLSDLKEEIISEINNKLDEKDKSFLQQLQKQEKLIEELKVKPNVTNNNLQIFCVSSNDNYLDMLTERWNSFDKALEYIKDCALSDLTGDCKLIKKIYCENANNIQFTDKTKTRITYYNEKKEKTIDSKESFGRKLANNLQNSYLKGVNYLITQTLTNRHCPNKFLEEYDVQLWNSHIYRLSDQKYQKQFINNLDVPLS